MSATNEEQRNQESANITTKLPDPNQNPNRFGEFSLQGKVFIVTGGGRGLALSLAEALVEAGGHGQYFKVSYIDPFCNIHPLVAKPWYQFDIALSQSTISWDLVTLTSFSDPYLYVFPS